MAGAGIASGMNRDSFLDSARTAVAAVIALLLARMLKMPESYWAPISTIVIVQSTIPPRTLGWQRFVGTALGAVLGAALATFFSPSVVVYGLGILLCGVLAFLLRVGGAYRFAGIALSIVLLIPHTLPPWIVGSHRFLEVSLGIAVALVVTTVWPRCRPVTFGTTVRNSRAHTACYSKNWMASVNKSRVLVTGADGFIGSHLAEQLVAAGARVRALSQYNSFNDWGWLEQVGCLKQIEVITGDVRDSNFCDELTRDIDIVFHLAALIPIPYSYRAPDSYVDTNVKGTLHLCQAARRNGVKRFIQTSTSEVYGTAQYVPIDEKHPLQPQSPYSATKIGSDCIALSFYYSFGLPLVVARPFNTYGPRQSARAVIPSIIIQIAGGATTISLGNLTATRDFTFVEDTCRGFLAIAEMEGGAGEVFHIGSNHEIAVGDLVTLIGEIMGANVRVTCDEQRLRPEKSEVQRLKCDNSKLRDASAFLPQIPLRQGLERTVHWFSQPENLRRYKSNLYNV